MTTMAIATDQNAWMNNPGSTPKIEHEDGPGTTIDPFRLFAAQWNTNSKVYSARWDEARRNSIENANAMLRDAYFRALLQERIAPLTRWNWHVVPDPDDVPDTTSVTSVGLGIAGGPNAKDPMSEEREKVAKGLSACVRRTKRFQDLRQYHGMSIWYGRYGSQLRWDDVSIAGQTRKVVGYHDPINGDKIHYTFSGQPGVMINPLAPRKDGWDIRTFDTYGPVLILDKPELRQNFLFTAHVLEDADYLDAQAAGKRFGVGLRDYVYWAWWLRDEMLSWLFGFMEKVGSLGILKFYYNESNAASKEAAIAAANKVGNGNALAIPAKQGGSGPQPGDVDVIQPNMTGVGFLKDVVKDTFESHIERLIVGQSMSGGKTKENGDGFGGTGMAEFAQDTKFNLLSGDAQRQQDAFTDDLVAPLKQFNYREMDCRYLFEYLLPDPKAKEKLENGTKLVMAGVSIKCEELREAGGYSKPGPEDEQVGGMQPGMGPIDPLTGLPMPSTGGMPGGPPGAGPGIGGNPNAIENGLAEQGKLQNSEQIIPNPIPNDKMSSKTGIVESKQQNDESNTPKGESDWRPGVDKPADTPVGDWRPASKTPEETQNTPLHPKGVSPNSDWRPKSVEHPTTPENTQINPETTPNKPEINPSSTPKIPENSPAEPKVEEKVNPATKPKSDWRPKGNKTPQKVDWYTELMDLRKRVDSLKPDELARLKQLEAKLQQQTGQFQQEITPTTYRPPISDMSHALWWDLLSAPERRVVIGSANFLKAKQASGLRGSPASVNYGVNPQVDCFALQAWTYLKKRIPKK